MKIRFDITLLALSIIGLSAEAKVKLPALISDGMVLQQQTDVRLWGHAKPGRKVDVTPSWNGRTYSTQAGKDGSFKISVPTPAGSETRYSIVFDDGEKTEVSDVAVGEVWLASGQSNMEMPLKGFVNCPVKDGGETVAKAGKNKKVRMFYVPHLQEYEPLDTCGGSWKTASPSAASEFSASAYYFADMLSEALDMPVGILNCAYGGSRVESWTDRALLETYPDVSLVPDSIQKGPAYLRPLLMYNGMLHPLHNYTIKGIIWYQGESNVGSHDTYAQRLANMVAMWRDKWELGEIPFYFAEIAPYGYNGRQEGLSPYLREAQYKAQKLIPNSAMFSTNDLIEPYEKDNIHPSRKQEVGHRFAFLALNKTYGMDNIPCEGPEYNRMEVEGNEIRLLFNNTGMGYSRNRDIEGFEIAGEDKCFYPADSVRVDWRNRSVVVSSEKVSEPVAVRYCFKDFQIGNMGGANQLPMVPFRTDNW